MTYLDRFWRILTQSGTDLAELLCAFILLGCGTGLINPFSDTFAANPKVWASMSMLAPECVWGAWFVVLGVLQLIGVLGRFKRIRLFAALAGAGLWVFMLVALVLANPMGITVFLYGPLAFLQTRTFVWHLIRRRGTISDGGAARDS